MSRRNGNTVSFKDYVERLDKASKEREEWFRAWLEKYDQDRKESAERLEKDRRASEERLAADRRASEERLAVDRKESEARFRTDRRWLVANFVAVMAVLLTLLLPLLDIQPVQQTRIEIGAQGSE